MTRRVLIHVQHLLGTGHLHRAAAIARAAAAEGLTVTLASGGMPLPGLDAGAAEIVQLAPVRVEGEDFSRLVDGDGVALDLAFKSRRRDALLALFERVRPEVVVIEMFPFGRRAFHFELIPLLGAAWTASPRPAVLVSVRDILTRRRPGRTEEAAKIVRALADAVLVHADPRIVRFEESFPACAAIAERLRYTGYVDAGGAIGEAGDGAGEVLVSAGGGAVGERLLTTALAAARADGRRRWRLLTGARMGEIGLAALRAAAPPHATVERFRPDFRRLMAKCAVSLSQAGYNTVVDILSARARAIVVPYARERETEQTLRGARFAAAGLLRCLEEEALTAARLASAIDAALAGPRPAADAVDLGGASASAAAIAEWAERAARGRMPA